MQAQLLPATPEQAREPERFASGPAGPLGQFITWVSHLALGVSKGVWRNGSASDSRSEGWEFESLCPQGLPAM